MIYIGCDNGVSGGLVAISDVAGVAPIAKLKMPVQRGRKGNEVDIRLVVAWMASLELREPTVVIEEPGGSKSAKAATSMAGSFHALRAMCEVRRYRWHRVTPAAWQRLMLPGCAPGESKQRALAAVRQIWPGESWVSNGCRVPDPGLVDAALIAEYARRTRL